MFLITFILYLQTFVKNVYYLLLIAKFLHNKCFTYLLVHDELSETTNCYCTKNKG